jgi:general secretion pathway protein H
MSSLSFAGRRFAGSALFRAPVHASRRLAGFTLVELMVVLVLVGIVLGVVTVNLTPGRQKTLQNEAQRIGLLLQVARDEAIVRNRQMAFEADGNGYRFWVRNGQLWELVTQDDLLREREFKLSPMLLSLDPPTNAPAPPLRITFGREPVDKPFVLTLANDGYSAAIRADGIGHFTVD